MPNTAVRANARTSPKPTKSKPAALGKLYHPGVPERGLKIIAKSEDEATANKNAAPAPKTTTAQDKYISALAEKCVAEVRFNRAAEHVKAEARAKAEEPKLEASRAFAQAHHAWLVAKAETENPSVEDEELADRFSAALPSAERRLMITPAAYPDQVWQKLEAFEAILGDEIMSGPRRDSVILLALASIKQDILNLELLEAVR
jgi:hypothetical protein